MWLEPMCFCGFIRWAADELNYSNSSMHRFGSSTVHRLNQLKVAIYINISPSSYSSPSPFHFLCKGFILVLDIMNFVLQSDEGNYTDFQGISISWKICWLLFCLNYIAVISFCGTCKFLSSIGLLNILVIFQILLSCFRLITCKNAILIME